MDADEVHQAEEGLRGLGKRDPLRPVVRRLLDGAPMSEADALLALQRLQAPQEHPWRTAALSALVVGQAPLADPTRQRVVSALRAAARRPAHRGPVRGIRNGCAWSLGIGATVSCAAVGAMSIPGPDTDPPILGALMALLLLSGLAAALLAPFIAVVRDRSAACRLQSAALRALGRLRDVASIGAMADACRDHREQKERAGKAALAEVLPVLSAEHYGTVSGGAIRALCATLHVYAGVPGQAGLGWQPDPSISIMILDALERVAGGSAVDAIRQVAGRSPHEPVRQRARAVLAVLEARQAQERDATRLLRPADGPTMDQLLRPAQATEEAPAEQLLRPVAGPDDQPAGS